MREIADAVLYEGYVLWPYRRSAMKNHQRWTFGGVHPGAWSEQHPDDAATMQTEVLVEGETAVRVRVRFLHVVRREVARRTDAGALEPVDELRVGEERHLAWDEAAERELATPRLRLGALAEPHVVEIDIPARRDEEELRAPDGSVAGALIRSWEPLTGVIEIGARRRHDGLYRLTVRIENTTPWRGTTREGVMRQTFCSTHTVIEATGDAQLVSLTDPPPELSSEVQACVNRGTWPVLAGEAGDRSTILSSPIILSDYPEIAPESPGDLFDGGEIDGMLVLNILALTDEEKAEMRDSDPKAREILERTEALTNDELLSLHGAVRDLRVVR